MAISQNMASTAGSANTIAKESHPDTLLLEHLEDLLRRNGRIELVLRDDSIDVRCDGVATYGRSLKRALHARVQVEIDRVTNRLSGDVKHDIKHASASAMASAGVLGQKP